MKNRLLTGALPALIVLAGSAEARPPNDAHLASREHRRSKEKVAWVPCGAPFECGTVHVPLDYNEPRGPVIAIALVRRPAGDPRRRIGSLFLNPGGPGESGVDFARGIAPFIYTDEVRSRFDIVGFDPRGVGQSTQLRCFRSEAEWAPYLLPFSFPTTADEEQARIAADRFLDSACDKRGREIANHMSSANVARDLDLLREAVGDQGLTYAGFSSGTYIGVTYANLFPRKVRALILDGVVDPVAWSTGVGAERETVPMTARVRSDASSLSTLREFFRLCDAGGERCPFSGNAEARFAALAQRLKAAPVEVICTAPACSVPGVPDGSLIEVGYSTLIGVTRDSLSNSGAWPDLALLLAGLESLVASEGQRALPPRAALRAATPYQNLIEGRPGIMCADTDNPHDYAAWSSSGAAADAAFGYFGRYWTWLSSVCAEWPHADADRYMGPFDARTAHPVLVVGNEFDPATRYEGAVAVANLLPSSALLTVHGWGHSSHGWGAVPEGISRCADEIGARYLVDLAVPAAGTVCEQDRVPFAEP